MRANLVFCVFGVTGLMGVQSLVAENWPAWRGLNGDGVCTELEMDLPLHWGATSNNVLWKVKLPDRGNSTPVVWGEKVLVTQALEKEGRRLLLCFDKGSGRKLWEAGVSYSEPELTHRTNPFCSGSPVTDGARVVVSFASAGVFCFDLNGKELWRRTDLGVQRHIWGAGTSPVLAGDRVFLNFGPGEGAALLCLDKVTGRTLWRCVEPGGASGEGEGRNWIGSWSDPLLRRVGEREELLMSWPGRVCAYDPASGREWWSCGGLNALVYSSPLFADGVVVGVGGFNGAALAVKAGGDGEVTGARRLWRLPKVSQFIGSGVVHEGRIYTVSDGGIAECRDLMSGQTLWDERLKGPGPTGQNWSSLVRCGERLYSVNQGGDAFVFKTGDKFELLATNSIGERVIGSLAVSDGRVFIRGYEHLWCIGKEGR